MASVIGPPADTEACLPCCAAAQAGRPSGLSHYQGTVQRLTGYDRERSNGSWQDLNRARKAAPAAAALAAAALLTVVWGLIAYYGAIDFIYNPEGVFQGWIAKALLNRFVSDPFSLQHAGYGGGSIIMGLFAVPIFHLLGDSLFHLALGGILWQAAIMAFLVALCRRAWGPWAALLAGLLMLCAPTLYIQRSMMVLSNHCEVALFAILNALLLWHLFKGLEVRGVAPPGLCILLGAVNGFGIFFSYGHLSVVAADSLALVPLLLRGGSRPGRAAAAVFLAAAGFAIGLSPWIHQLLTHDAHYVSLGCGWAFWRCFGAGDILAKTVRLWEDFRMSMPVDIALYAKDLVHGELGPILGFLSRAIFAAFPLGAIIGFALFTFSGFVRRSFSATKWIEAWCCLYVLIHLTVCWAYESGSEPEPRYLYPMFPVLCAMGGAVASRIVRLQRPLLKWSGGALATALALAVFSLSLLTWRGVCFDPAAPEATTWKYKGYSERLGPRHGLFADPVAQVHAERSRVGWSVPSPPWAGSFFYTTVEMILREGWDRIEKGLAAGEAGLERSMPAMTFNVGETACLEGLGLEELHRDLEPVVPERYRHFLFMGYSYFLRLGGIEETERAMRSLHAVDPKYRHYFLLAHGACLGARYRSEPERVRSHLFGQAEAGLDYLAAGALWTPSSRNLELAASLAEALPEPVRGVIECERLGACSSPFGIGVEAARKAGSLPPYFPTPYDSSTEMIDWNSIYQAIEGSPDPAASSRGAGAALAMIQPWRIPWAVEDLGRLPEALRDELTRGYLEAALWFLGGDRGPIFDPPS